VKICIAHHVNTANVLRMARVNEGSHSFTCHPHICLRMEFNESSNCSVSIRLPN